MDLFIVAFEFSKKFRKVSSSLIQRKFKVNHETATKLCRMIRLQRWKDAREEAKRLYGM